MSNRTPPVPSSAANAAPRYPWQRFWAARTDTLDLSDYGFLADPTTRISLRAHPPPVSLVGLASYHALILLGEPGIGKSTALTEEAARVQSDSAADKRTVLHIDLRAYSNESLLYKRLFESPEFLAWVRSDTEMVLYLDSLDEALLRIDSIANLLASELPYFPVKRLYLRIACRTAMWPSATLEPALIGIWGAAGVGAFELAPLRRRDVIAAAEAHGLDAAKFIAELFAASAVPFAIKPLTLNMLLDLYKRDGKLPTSLAELYRQGCSLLCEETNASRRDSRRLGTLSGPQRLRLAGRIASVTMLANRYAIWTGPANAAMPEEDVALAAIAGGREEGDFPAFEVTEDHIREVLDTGLFSSRGGVRMGWAHQGYAEFLAALYLIEKEVAPATVLKTLDHPSGGLVPQLAVVAAWTSSMSRPVRAALIAAEPAALLRGDLSAWSDDDRAALTASLLSALKDKRANDFGMRIFDQYARLAHPGLAAQLQPVIADNAQGVVERRAAIMIAEACKVTSLQSELLGLALDATDDPHLRARAVAALRTCGDNTVPTKLRALAEGTAGPDPQDELRGYAMQLLWPDHIDASDLFPLLTRPNEGYVGSYVMFVTHTLPESLAPADLPAALTWAAAFVGSAPQHDMDFQRKSLADSVLARAWAHLDQAPVLAGIMEYVRAALSNYGDLLRGTDQTDRGSFLQVLERDAARRRLFLKALAASSVAQTDMFNYRPAGLLQGDDFFWVLSLAPGAAAADSSLNDETLSYMVENLWDMGDSAQFEALYAAATAWPRLWNRYRGLFEGIALDSVDAQRDREIHASMERRKERNRHLVSPPPAERIASLLGRFESGTWRAFWQLNRELTLKPTSTHYGPDLAYDITAMPGWTASDTTTRSRIIAAAERYLRVGKTSVADWIGRPSIKFNDLAAFRAFLLLKTQKPEAYGAIALEDWQKWAPAIFAVPKGAGNREPECLKDIIRDALVKAPAQFVRAVRAMIRRERAQAAKSTSSVLPGSSFHYLRDLGGCWDQVPLSDGVFAELQETANSVDQFTALLDALLAAKYAPACDDTIARMTDGRLSPEYALAAASSLTVHCAAEVWPSLWPNIVADNAFARALFLNLAGHYRFEESFFTALSERQLGELYVFLEKVFPRKDDPIHPSGQAHFVGPDESLAHMRDGIPRVIVARGTIEAVETLRWVAAELPALDWLPYSVLEADQLMRMRTWVPLTASETKRLTENRKARLVQSPADLLELLVQSFSKYEQELHGEQRPVRDLWDRQASGLTYRPIEEDSISDHVKRFLQRELGQSGIIANREVEISRGAGGRMGKRTDIRIDAIRRAEDGTALDTITAIIETKGCWNSGLFTALKSQLFDDYMRPLTAPVGIYLVGWFDKSKWDNADRRYGATPNKTIPEVQAQLDAQASGIPSCYMMRAIVLACQAP